MSIPEFLRRFEGATKTGGQWLVKCPAHDDRKASLAVREGDGGRIVLHCHAGCSAEAIVTSLGMTLADLFEESRQARREVATYDYRDESGVVLYQVVRFEPKDFRQRRPDGRGGYLWSLKDVRRVLYRLDELQGKEAAIVCEGEKDVDELRAIHIPATCNVAGAGKWRDDYTQQLLAAGVKRVRVIPDNDEPGRAHADHVARSCRAAGLDVRIVALSDVPAKGDVSDYLAGHSKDQLVALIQTAPVFDDRGARGVQVKPEPQLESELESPVPTVADGQSVAVELVAFVRRFLVLTDDQLVTFCLWILHCHAFEAADTTPYLAVTSAGKQAGKTRLLEVAELVTPKPWLTGRASAAVLVRKIAGETPTLLLDESDAAFKQTSEYSEALRAILNAGFRRGGKASLCVKEKGGDFGYKDFSTFCPKAIAGIGDLPDTIADRSIAMRIRRKLRTESVERFRERGRKKAAAQVYPQLVAWAAAHVSALRDAEPSLPDGLRDRAADVWEPLIAIADQIGGDWPTRARAAAVRLSGGAEATEDSPAQTLLGDLQTVFGEMTADEVVVSTELVARLKKLDGRPWADWGRGKGLTTSALARLLKGFDIHPGDPKWVVIEGERQQRRGYRVGAFQDVFARWLGSNPSQCNNPNNDGPESTISSRNMPLAVTPSKMAISSITTGLCYGVTTQSLLCEAAHAPDVSQADVPTPEVFEV